MAKRGRGHGRGCGRGQGNVENVNEIIEMMRMMVVRMDSIEEAQRRGIKPMIRDDNDDEEELEIINEELDEKMTMEERMIRAISSIGGKPNLDTLVYSSSLNLKELIY